MDDSRKKLIRQLKLCAKKLQENENMHNISPVFGISDNKISDYSSKSIISDNKETNMTNNQLTDNMTNSIEDIEVAIPVVNMVNPDSVNYRL